MGWGDTGLVSGSLALLSSVGCGRASEASARAEPPVLYRGSREAPIVGIRFGPEPIVHYRDLSEAIQPGPGWVRVDPGQEAFFSEDSRHIALSRFQAGRTHIRLDQEPEFSLEGEFQLGLDATGSTVVAHPRNVAEGQTVEVLVLDRAGEVHTPIPAKDVLWVTLAGDGKSLAIGTEEHVQVIDREGATLVQLPPAESAALSEDGKRIALESHNELELLSVDAPFEQTSRGIEVPGEPFSLRFAGRRWLLRVAPERLQVLDVAVDPAALVVDAAPPAGFAWRDADTGSRGEIAASRIQVERPARRERDGSEDPFRPGSTLVAVDRFVLGERRPKSVEWKVPLWNRASPQLRFGPDGRLYAIVWPSAFEIVFP